MHILKKTLKISGIVLLALIVLAFTIPIVFKKQITGLVKKEINRNLVAKVDFDDVSLSLFRRFPRVSISIEDLSITGQKGFSNDTLIYAKELNASANLISVIKGKDIKIFGVSIESPRVHALVNKEGMANWDIVKQEPEDISVADSSSSSPFQMSLKSYTIHNGYIEYIDETTGTYAELEGVEHQGSGDFTQDIFTLNTKTNAASASFTQDAIPYLVNVNTGIEAAIQIDNPGNTYKFKTDEIELNNLKLSTEGFVQFVNDSTYRMDVQFKSPSNSFREILSLIPALYTKDFEKLNAGGEASIKGFLKGIYSPNQMPSYDVAIEVRNGSFQYPDLPKPVKNIQLDIRALNPDGKPDNAILDISKGHIEMDGEPFDFRFLFKNPETIKFIDAAVTGKLNLSQLSQFIKLEEGTKLGGLVSADAFVRGNLSAIQSRQGDFAAGGFFDVKDLSIHSKEFPQPLRKGDMNIKLENTGGIADNTTVEINGGHIEVGNDPVDFNFRISNPVSLLNFEGNTKGRLTLDNFSQLMELEEGSQLSGSIYADLHFAGNKIMIEKEQYDRIKLEGTARVNNLNYRSVDYPTGIKVSKLSAALTPPNVTINEFSGTYLQSNFQGSGTLENLMGYFLGNKTLSGSLTAVVDKMNLNDWIATEGTGNTGTSANSTTTTPTPFLVPGNLEMKILTKAGRVTYDKVNYDNINGLLWINGESIKLEDVEAKALKGEITLNGSYSTKYEKKNPDITMSYAIKDMDVQQAFLSFNTVQALMPIGKFLSGKLSSELTMTGSLDGNMMPDLNSLSGKGNLLLIEGVLAKFAPLEKLASTLQIDRLRSISVKDIKNYIEFANGKVLVKPFNVKVQDIEMQIGGMHGFDQSLNYIIAMKVPRKYMGSGGNSLVNGLAAQATSQGVPVKLGEIVNLNVKMEGTVSNPIIKINLEQMASDVMNELKEQAKDFAKQKIDSAAREVKDTIKAIKNEVKEQAKQEVREKLKEQFLGKDTSKASVDSSKKAAGGVIRDKMKSFFNRPKKN